MSTEIYCSICGCWLATDGLESSAYLGTDVCLDCQVDHCLSTNCLGCDRGNYPNCEHTRLKEYYRYKDGDPVVMNLSYGKDSLASLHVAIDMLGWNVVRIAHAEVWATDTIPGDFPDMVEFKSELTHTSLIGGALSLNTSNPRIPSKVSFMTPLSIRPNDLRRTELVKYTGGRT